MNLIKSRGDNKAAEKSIDATASVDELDDEVEIDDSVPGSLAETTDAASFVLNTTILPI